MSSLSLDINLNYLNEGNLMVLKNVPMLSFYRLIMSGKTGLGAIEKKVIDRTVQMIYQSYFADYSQRM